MTQQLPFTATRLADLYSRQIANGFFRLHTKHIDTKLRELGAVKYDMLLPETHTLPLVIQPTETLQGVVYGKYLQDTGTQEVSGRGMLAATDARVLLIDSKPLFVKCEEITYLAVSGVTFTRVGFIGRVVLHTKLGTFTIRTFNHMCAQNFVAAIEQHIF